MKGRSEEIAGMIELAQKFSSEGMTIKQIAKKLKIPHSTAHIYSKGFVSDREYKRELIRLTNRYKRALENKVEELGKVGYSIKNLRESKGSLIIKFSEKELSVDSILDDFREHLEICLKDFDIGRRDGMFKVSYDNGYCSIKGKDIDSRAFLSAYARVVLKRECV